MSMDGTAHPTSEHTSDTRAALLARLLAEEGLDAQATPSMPRRTGGGPAPLSFAQEVLWLLDRASPGQTAYNSPVARRVRGPLDVTALDQALRALTARHDALRAVFAQSGEQAVQDVRPVSATILELIDVRSLPDAAREAEAIRRLRAVADTPFDLTTGPPFRAALARIADDHAILLLLTHHIASDAWSYGILFRDLASLYDLAIDRAAAPIRPVEFQFADHAAWERGQLQGAQLADRLAWWRERLGGQAMLELPTLRPVTSAISYAGARRELRLSPAMLRDIPQLAQGHQVTPYMVLLAAYQTVFHRYSGQNDITVGSAVAGRTTRESEEIVGYFSQALPMRTQLDGDPTFAELLARVSETVLGAFDHQDVPLEALVLELQRDNPGQAALFRAVLTMQDAIGVELRLGSAKVTPVELEASATKFDLTMLVSEREEGLDLSLWYRTELFSAAQVDRLLDHMHSVLAGAIGAPSTRLSALPLLSSEETASIASLESGGAVDAVELLPASILRHATGTPDSPALVDGEQSVSYGELVARARQLAARLRAHGVTRGALVGLGLERSADAVVAMLASWMAGAAYVPLVPDLPMARLQQQAGESGLRVVITRAAMASRLPAGLIVVPMDDEETPGSEGVLDTPAPVQPDDVAYVLFTSGSTGVPKGVAVTHGNIAHYANAIRTRLGLDAGSDPGARYHFATVTTLGADLGHTAILPALATGGTLYLISTDVATNSTLLAEYFRAHPVDLLKVTPSHLQALVAGRSGPAVAELMPKRWLVMGGEAFPWNLAETLLAADRCRVFNHYGPTETTVGAVVFEVTPASMAQARAAGAQTVPIGMPLKGAVVHVLDARGSRLPVAVPGELCIGGTGVAQGYLNQPERTAERFVPDAVTGEAVMYRTGDRVRWLDNGALEFLGRIDHQVKVRGYRVELGEIEAVLRSHPAVAQAAVLLQTGTGEGEPAALVAYVAPKATSGYAVAHAERLTGDLMTRFVGERLPEYMVPSTVVVVDQMPLTANGKIDTAALAALAVATDAAKASVAPRNATEIAVTAIWCEVFKRDGIGVTDQFLQLGGHSLLAIRILGKLTRTFGVRLPLRALFDAPTVEQLSRLIDETRAAAAVGGEGGT